MNCYNNNECQPRRLKIRLIKLKQMHTFSHDPQIQMQSSGHCWKKQLTLCQRLIVFLQAKECPQTLDYFHPFIGLSRSLHCHPQEIFSLPDIKLTLGICRSHLKHYRVTDYIGAVFNHSACQKSVHVSGEGDYRLTLSSACIGLADIGFRGESLS